MGLIFFWKTAILISVFKKVYMLPNVDVNDVPVTDMSPCEDGWKHRDEYCFKLIDEPVVWREASEHCISMGGHLASIHSQKQNDLMIHLFAEFDEDHWWIGLHDQDLDGIFEWVDGTDIDYTNWNSGVPSEKYYSGDCVGTNIKFHHGKWIDHPCDLFLFYPCQKKAASVIPSAAISDRAIAKAEISGTHPLFVKTGSSINLTCIITQSPEPPTSVFWYHEERMLNYDSSRKEITIQQSTVDSTISRLYIKNATDDDSGSYRCSPSNTEATCITVYVLKGTGPLFDNFKDLYISKRFSDVTLTVKKREFSAHKNVLSCRLTEFSSMEENIPDRVAIPDCDPDSFEEFLIFLYTGKLVRVSSKKAMSLYQTAAKYKLQELKVECSLSIAKNDLNIDSFYDIIGFANLHNDFALQRALFDFFITNAKLMLSTKKWERFLVNDPLLGNRLFLAYVKGKN